MKEIFNDYNSIADLWWSDDFGPTASLRYLINPVRIQYFKKHIDTQYMSGHKGMKVLDVGCGGGFISEELSKFGLHVTGVDQSSESIRVASEHASSSGLSINYLCACGEDLPFNNGFFDMVFCCDVLEHVSDPCKVISEISRVLKNGGWFFFDTINRTLKSWITSIYLMQRCPLTSLDVVNGHVWNKFIKPAELKSLMSKHGMTCESMRGISLEQNLVSVLIGINQVKGGKISYKELGQRIHFTDSNDLSCSYMGCAAKG